MKILTLHNSISFYFKKYFLMNFYNFKIQRIHFIKFYLQLYIHYLNNFNLLMYSFKFKILNFKEVKFNFKVFSNQKNFNFLLEILKNLKFIFNLLKIKDFSINF